MNRSIDRSIVVDMVGGRPERLCRESVPVVPGHDTARRIFADESGEPENAIDTGIGVARPGDF